jgi:predicted amidohydrolase YtcJ
MSLWIKNANIATMDEQNPVATSAVVIGDFFAYVGDEQGAAAFLAQHPQKELQELDCKGQFLLPGFNDSHMHYMHYCKAKMGANLGPSSSIDDLVARMKDFFDNRYDKTSGLWVTGEGWNQDNFTDEKRFPNNRDLDAVTTEYPILVMRTCFHVGAMNSKAMELLGINKDTVGKYGEYAELWPDGTPNGVVKEIVLDDIKCNLPAPSLDQLLEKLIESQHDLFEYGITSVQSDDFKYFPDGGAYDMMARIRKASDRGELKLRIAEQALMYSLEEMETFFDENGWDDSFGNRSFKISCIKLLADGSLGARTAFMRQPYADDPTTKGLALFSQEDLDAMVWKAHENNMAAAIHAIGDGAIEMCLDAIEKARKGMPHLHPRHGIVHCQITDEKQLQRFKELDVIAYIQPVFIDYDMHIVFDRVGKTLGDTSYAWKTLIESGVKAPFGTDCPVENFDPFRGIYCAATGKDTQGRGPAWPQQILSRQQALYGYTAAGAYSSFDETVKGKIQPGMYADFITLDTDLLTCADEDILKAKVTATYINGNCVFSR